MSVIVKLKVFAREVVSLLFIDENIATSHVGGDDANCVLGGLSEAVTRSIRCG